MALTDISTYFKLFASLRGQSFAEIISALAKSSLKPLPAHRWTVNVNSESWRVVESSHKLGIQNTEAYAAWTLIRDGKEMKVRVSQALGATEMITIDGVVQRNPRVVLGLRSSWLNLNLLVKLTFDTGMTIQLTGKIA